MACDYQPMLHKGLRLSFIAFVVLQMAGCKNAVKLCLDLVKHHSSPCEAVYDLPLIFYTFTTVLSWYFLPMTSSGFSPMTSSGSSQVYSGDYCKLCSMFYSPREPLLKSFFCFHLSQSWGWGRWMVCLCCASSGGVFP